MEKSVNRIHFEDRNGIEFERLCFAYLVKTKEWEQIDWLGQSGGDKGRDIWGIDSNGKTHCYQCANYKQLKFNKVEEDIDKLIENKYDPDFFVLICGGNVSSAMKEKINAYSKDKGIRKTIIWSGVEFEEKLRKNAPEIIKRFVDGVEFPELPSELIKFSNRLDYLTDVEIIQLISECFNRPAFTTPFKEEVSIPNFEKAITDTIEVLNTGMYRLRDGTLIKQIPSRHRIQSSSLKNIFNEITEKVIKLRYLLQRLKHEDKIERCKCNEIDCPVYLMSTEACDLMDNYRREILREVGTISGMKLNLK